MPKKRKEDGEETYPSLPVGQEADEVIDRSDGLHQNSVDSSEKQESRQRPCSVWHLFLPNPLRNFQLSEKIIS